MAYHLPTPTFALGDTVYQRVSPEDGGGIVTGILYRPGKVILYMVSWGVARCTEETQHWEGELTVDRAFEVPGRPEGD